MSIPFPIDPPPVCMPCNSFAHALKVLTLARENCLRAAYLPHGGDATTHYEPVTHEVWVMGPEDLLREFRAKLVKTSESKT